MMKKLLVLLLSAMMVFSLVACGDEDTTGGYTKEQQEYVDAYNKMLKDYQAAIDIANDTPALVNDKELTDSINEVTDDINTIAEAMEDPETFTDELMNQLDDVIDAAYVIANRIETYAELLPVFTIAGVGTDEDENTYWYACNEDETVGAMVIMTADQKQNVYCIGEMKVDKNDIYTIKDEEGNTMTMKMEVEGDIVYITMQNGAKVTMMGAKPSDVIEMMLTIDETTENINP